jgi:hypothetical protein
MIAFFIGCFVGTIVGWGACAMFTIGKRGD